MKEGSLMVTAVEYPEGCFWQRDSSGGTGECHISLYCNGSRTVSVPSGAGFPASHDPDMHRCIDGKLYTDYSDAGRTYVCTLLLFGSKAFHSLPLMTNLSIFDE